MAAGAWMLMADGRSHYLTGVDVAHNVYHVPTLAHHLACINRFTGAAARPYSVAEHSLLCADIAADLDLGPLLELACLMHDAHEAVTGDMSTPMKRAMGQQWHWIEGAHERALRRALGLQVAFAAGRETIKQVDLIALATERRDLLPWRDGESEPWPALDTPGAEVRPWGTDLASRKREQAHWTEWRGAFAERYHALADKIKAQQARQMREAAC